MYPVSRLIKIGPLAQISNNEEKEFFFFFLLKCNEERRCSMINKCPPFSAKVINITPKNNDTSNNGQNYGDHSMNTKYTLYKLHVAWGLGHQIEIDSKKFDLVNASDS